LPSVADLIFLALLGALVFTPLLVKLLGDAGIGWHIRTGQLILATHEVPRVDPFSSQIRLQWFAWEWLYDVAVGKLEAWFGLNGVVWLTAVVIAAVFGWMFRLLVKRGTNLFVALVLMLLALSGSTIHFLARPHVLTWLFTLAWFWILDSSEPKAPGQTKPGERRLWFLPPLMVLWVNVHGGFLIGFVLLAIYWLGAAWTWLVSNPNRIEDLLRRTSAGNRVRQLTLVGAVSALASLINPYGWSLHAHIYSYLTNSFLMDHIDEFQSPNFHGIAQKCFLALLIITLAVLLARGRSLGVTALLTLLFAVYAALSASRNIPIASILLVMIAGPAFAKLDSGFSRRMTAMDNSLRGHLWPILGIVLTLAIAENGGRVGTSRWMDAHFDPNRMPVQAVSFLETRDVKGPILSPDYWGGYLIYRLYPHTKVEIDDRHDFYGEYLLTRYLATFHVEPGWEQFLRWQSCLVLPKKAALTEILYKAPEWKIIYADDVAVVFMRAKRLEDSDRAPLQ